MYGPVDVGFSACFQARELEPDPPRPNLMTRVTALLATVATALALVGCARSTHEGESPATATSTPSAPTGAGCLTGSVTITEADGGRSVCVTTGSTVDVVLHGSAEQRWSPVEENGQALRVRVSGKGSLPVGVTAAYFSTAEPGSAALTSSRPVCPSPAANGVSCMARVSFEVTVTVR